MTDIIFIGAGPIGLLGAIQLKLQCPEKEILMFEKYREPVRNHAMYVQQSSFAGMNRDEGFGAVLDKIPTKVIISDLEKTLRAYATSIGIGIIFEDIRDFNELKSRYPETEYFVGSGGLRGIIHPQVFADENQINEPLRHAVEVKYKAIGVTRALSKLSEVPGVSARSNHLISEYVGHEKEGLTPISLRIFIDALAYDFMKSATFKSPYTLEDKDKIPEDLYQSITNYLRGRNLILGERILDDSLRISTITLSIYASRFFCTRSEGKTIFQIGEEGFACPFYRSFNDNALCIPFFTRAMKALFDNQPIESETFISNSQPSSSSFWNPSSSSISIMTEEPLEYYQRKVQGIVNSEIRTIHALNFGINMIESSVSSSRAFPMISGSGLSFHEGGRAYLRDVEQGRSDDDHRSSLSKCTLL